MKTCERCGEYHVDDYVICLELQVKNLKEVLMVVAAKVDRGTQRFIIAKLGKIKLTARRHP